MNGKVDEGKALDAYSEAVSTATQIAEALKSVGAGQKIEVAFLREQRRGTATAIL